ncbi:MAG: hypothetical protein JWN08_2025, partial [Frankiales bacterium]|nr:hypothetical protein [Frankiales bacterium]
MPDPSGSPSSVPPSSVPPSSVPRSSVPRPSDRVPARLTGPAGSARTAVVWEVLSAVLAEADPGGAGLDVLDAGGGTGGFAVPLARAG